MHAGASVCETSTSVNVTRIHRAHEGTSVPEMRNTPITCDRRKHQHTMSSYFLSFSLPPSPFLSPLIVSLAKCARDNKQKIKATSSSNLTACTGAAGLSLTGHIRKGTKLSRLYALRHAKSLRRRRIVWRTRKKAPLGLSCALDIFSLFHSLFLLLHLLLLLLPPPHCNRLIP